MALGQLRPGREQGLSDIFWWQPTGRQKLTFNSTKMPARSLRLTELWITASWDEASPSAFRNATWWMEQTKTAPSPSQKMLSLLHQIASHRRPCKSAWWGAWQDAANSGKRHHPIISLHGPASPRAQRLDGHGAKWGHWVCTRVDRARGHFPRFRTRTSFPSAFPGKRCCFLTQTSNSSSFQFTTFWRWTQVMEKHTQLRYFDHFCQKTSLTPESP